MAKSKTSGPKMKKLNGRIYIDGAEAFLQVKAPRASRGKNKGEPLRIPLAGILQVLKSDPRAADKDVLGAAIQNDPSVKGLLKRGDIGAVRLYAHRYGYGLNETPPKPELLIDECVLIDAVMPLSHAFGYATHVDLEGLGGTETQDAEIWQHAIDAEIPAFVTTDRDFLGESLKQRGGDKKSPFLIYLSGRRKPDLDGICQLFQRHAQNIRQMMDSGASRGCRLSLAEGCVPIHS